MKASIGTACTIIGTGEMPDREIRRMRTKAITHKSTTDREREFLIDMGLKRKLTQMDRKEIRRIYLKGRRR